MGKVVWKKPLVAFVQLVSGWRVSPCLPAAPWWSLAGGREEGNEKRAGCWRELTQDSFFLVIRVFQVTNIKLGPFAAYFAGEKTKPQESKCPTHKVLSWWVDDLVSY